jgi:RNA polymerase sigma-70 factor (ECF subfamily)
MENVEEVLLRHRGKLLGFIQKRVADPDAAEDVLQDGLLKALRSSGELRDDERLLPWFYQILQNAIIDTYRKRSVEMRYLETFARETGLDTASEDHTELCACLRELLPSLKPEYAQLIDRLELQPGDPGKVAQQLNIQPNNLKVRRHRARQALKQRLEETCRTCAVHGCLDCTCELSASSHAEKPLS